MSLLVGIIVAFLSSSYVGVAGSFRKSRSGEEEEGENCQLWLGPSSVDKNRLGVYAGREWKQGDDFSVGNDNLAIPVVDLDEHNKNDDSFDIGGFVDATWNAGLMGMGDTEGENDVAVAMPGLGMLIQHHPSIYNLDWDHTTFFTSEDAVTFASPNRGAMAPHSKFGFQVTQHIPQGMELFLYLSNHKNHEDDQLPQRNPDIPILSSQNYQKVDQIMTDIQEFFREHEDDYPTIQEQEQVYQFLKDHVIPIVTRTDSYNEHATLPGLLPKQISKLQAVQETGGSIITHYPKMIQSMAWLKKNAQCIDTLYVDSSTIPNAGEGAFAKLSFSKGDVIAPMPVITIHEKHYFFNNEEESETKQLILNYSFGHPQSSLLFVPMGHHTSFINHATKLSQANAKLVWSSAPYSHHTTLHQYNPSQLRFHTKNLMMGFDIVATKPILPGQEVLINYGIEWQLAWDQHIQQKHYNNKDNWLKKQSSSAMVQKLNRAAHKNTYRKPFPIEGELLPDNVQTMCFISISEYVSLNGIAIKEEWQQEGYNYVYEHDPSLTREEIIRGKKFRPCKIIERTFDGVGKFYVYTVSFDEEQKVMLNLPHEYIRYASKPYTSDIHWDNAFRHPIGIPDSIFPPAWKDLL